jgi:two-component system response regulator RegX3
MAAHKNRILVVEDDPAIRNGLVDILVFKGYAVHGRSDGQEGLQLGLAEHFDLVILDVMLPSLDGFSICKELRKAKPQLGILILTAKGAEDDIVTGFKSGADDYLCKPFSIRELVLRVEALLRRVGKVPVSIRLQWCNVEFNGDTLTGSRHGKTVALTRREMEIMAYLYRHRQRIVSKKELLTEVWQYAHADIETRTVDIHIMKLRKKIAALSQGHGRITTIRGEGYRLESDR